MLTSVHSRLKQVELPPTTPAIQYMVADVKGRLIPSPMPDRGDAEKVLDYRNSKFPEDSPHWIVEYQRASLSLK